VTTPAPPTGSPGAGSGIVVRELRWSDFDPLREMYYLLYDERETNPEIGLTLFSTRPTIEDETAWFTGLFRRVMSGDAVVSIAEHNAVVVGNCTIGRVGPSPTHEAAHVGLLGIIVHRDHRGTGVGTALLANALDQARARFEVVNLSVLTVNRRARRLYERFGFRYVGTRPAHLKRGDRYFDEDLMVLDLRPAHANR